MTVNLRYRRSCGGQLDIGCKAYDPLAETQYGRGRARRE